MENAEAASVKSYPAEVQKLAAYARAQRADQAGKRQAGSGTMAADHGVTAEGSQDLASKAERLGRLAERSSSVELSAAAAEVAAVAEALACEVAASAAASGAAAADLAAKGKVDALLANRDSLGLRRALLMEVNAAVGSGTAHGSSAAEVDALNAALADCIRILATHNERKAAAVAPAA